MFRKKQSSLPDTVSELELLRTQLLNRNAILLEKREMTPDMERILEYFWNTRKQKLRLRLPEAVIWFYETDDWHETLSNILHTRVDVLTLLLQTNGWIVRKQGNGGIFFELTPTGVAYMKDKHPTVFAYWKRFLEFSPPTLTLLAALIGFVASVFGIIQFVAWWKDK